MLDTQNAEDFECIKTALLSAFQIDADSCKNKFESARLYPSETITQFLVRIRGLWKRWEDISNIDQTYEGLTNEILRAKLFTVLNSNVIVHLKIHKTTVLSEVSDLADNFIKAHNVIRTPNTNSQNNFKGSANQNSFDKKFVGTQIVT